MGSACLSSRDQRHNLQIDGLKRWVFSYIEEMTYMDNLELAPQNIGKTKKYGAIIRCKQSFLPLLEPFPATPFPFKGQRPTSPNHRLALRESHFKGTVHVRGGSKTANNLVYNVIRTMGQKMFIDPIQGEKLILQYLGNDQTEEL